MNPHNDENQQLLDELMNQSKHQMDENSDFPKFYNNHNDNSNLARQYGQSDHSEFVYPGNAPAFQHEKLAYMNNNSHNTGNNEHLMDAYPAATQQHTGSHHDKYEMEQTTSFLDDMFTTTHMHPGREHSITNPQEISQSFHSQSFSEPVPPELLFQHNLNDTPIDYTDDLSSSLGSSVHSELMDSSYGQPSSFSLNAHNIETLNSLTSNSFNNNNNNFSPSVRSPASSFRPSSNYLSTSLRQPSTLANLAATPNSRQPSISNNIDCNLSTSVPKSVSHSTHDDKLRRKRDFHNAVERRRRDLIKQKINELGNLVPPTLLCVDSGGKQVKPNKGIILNKTVDYVHFLLKVLDAQEHKKQQLTGKIDELQNKFNNLDLKTVPKASSTSLATLTNENYNKGTHIPEGQERIIDSRAHPQPRISVKSEIHDNLHQFFSGNVVEVEDNAKLNFGDNNRNNGETYSNPADYLLEFDS